MALKPTTRSTGREKQARREYDQRRGSARERGYTWEWEKAAAQWKQENPLCVECDRQGRLTPSAVVDHVRPHKGDEDWFWNQENWEAICKRCHDTKTRMEQNIETYRRTVVTGPPGSGKTTYVQRHRKAGDLVWDWDCVAKEMLRLPMHQTPQDIIPHLNAMAEVLFRELATRPPKRDVWVILTDTTRAKAIAGLMSGEVVELTEVFRKNHTSI